MPNSLADSIADSKPLNAEDRAIVQVLVQQMEEELAPRCRDDSSLFTSFIMQDPDTGLYFTQDELHDNWHNCFDKYLWNLVEAPRKHGKSEQVMARVIHNLGKNPDKRYKWVSNNDTQAAKRVSAIADHIDHNKRIRMVFPDLLPDKATRWTGHAINVKRTMFGITEPSLEGYGILSSGTGARADGIVFDDVVDFENTIKNPALMIKVIEAYENKWINLLTRDGWIIYIFTRWHQKDLSHYLIADKCTQDEPQIEEYKYTVNLINDELDPISELWPHDRLVARLRSTSRRAFARNFQGRAMTQDESLFGSIDTCRDFEYGLDDIHVNHYRQCFVGVDPGHRGGAKAKTSSPYSVIFVGLVLPDGIKVPIDIRRGKWTPDEFAEQLIAVHQQYHPWLMLVENNGYQEAVESLVRLKSQVMGATDVPTIKGYFTGKQKMDESLGLPGMAAQMENKQWKIPMKGQEHRAGCNCKFCSWIDELKMYPVGEFSDQLMASWLFMQATAGGASKPSDIITGEGSDLSRELEDFHV